MRRRKNPEAAQQLGLKLIDRALTLSEPGCSLMGSALRKRPKLRKLVEGNYLIIYRVLPNDQIRVLRFWHAAQSPERLKFG
jgi:plasmid stabilization system protein ParE